MIINGDTITFGNPYGILNGAIACPANGLPVTKPTVDLRLVINRYGNVIFTATDTSYTDICTVPFSSDEARILLRAGPQIITNDLTLTIINGLKVKNYKAIRLSDEKQVVWNGAKVLWIYDTKSSYIDTIRIKDIRFKLCCPKNDFNYNHFNHNDNKGEGFGILIGDSHHSLIEVC
ncbi:hypothetical protein [Rickettsia australis]|uniref:Uncharacterized protein n=1 Tax=Rickettsia australis (strain Cutlack) TaxID=1105110 RepID=H8K8H3_RICAC|nr:hypothetical protein [Rickettsia australis]AFC71566.1 hypothetical protein MC5_06640 [Rickettsia australis str. Cutlack]